MQTKESNARGETEHKPRTSHRVITRGRPNVSCWSGICPCAFTTRKQGGGVNEPEFGSSSYHFGRPSTPRHAGYCPLRPTNVTLVDWTTLRTKGPTDEPTTPTLVQRPGALEYTAARPVRARAQSLVRRAIRAVNEADMQEPNSSWLPEMAPDQVSGVHGYMATRPWAASRMAAMTSATSQHSSGSMSPPLARAQDSWTILADYQKGLLSCRHGNPLRPPPWIVASSPLGRCGSGFDLGSWHSGTCDRPGAIETRGDRQRASF